MNSADMAALVPNPDDLLAVPIEKQGKLLLELLAPQHYSPFGGRCRYHGCGSYWAATGAKSSPLDYSHQSARAKPNELGCYSR